MAGVGIITFVIGYALRYFGIEVSDSDIATFAGAVVAFVGAVFTFWGQIRRTDLKYGLLRNEIEQ